MAKHYLIDSADKKPLNIETIDQLIEYYFPRTRGLSESLPTADTVKLRHFILAMVCVSGAYPFMLTADEYARSTYGEDAAGWRAYFMLSAAGWSTGLFYDATIFFLDAHRREQIPSHLTKLLVSPMSSEQQLIKKIVLGVGSALSALPLAILAILYSPNSIPAWAKYLLFAVVLFDDAILHFLPIELAFQNPIYRFPIYPFEKLYEHIKSTQLLPEARLRREIQEKNTQVYATYLKDPLKQFLTQAKIALTVKAASVDLSLQYHIALPENLQENRFILMEPCEKLQALIQYGQDTPMSTQDTNSHQMVAFFGCIWGEFGDAGFILTCVDEMISLTNSVPYGILVVALPIYFYGVLVAFFGSASMLTSWIYFTDHAPGDIKLALPFKLWPKSAAIYGIFALAMVGACYGVPVELVNTSLSEENPMRTPLVVIAITSSIIVTSYIYVEFYCTIFKDLTLYGDYNDAQWITQLGAQIDEFVNAIEFLNGSKLLTFLESLDTEKLKSMGITQESLSACREKISASRAESLIITNEEDGLKQPTTRESAFLVDNSIFNSQPQIVDTNQSRSASTYVAPSFQG